MSPGRFEVSLLEPGLVPRPVNGDLQAMNLKPTLETHALGPVPNWDRVGILEWRQPRLLRSRWELFADGGLVATIQRRGTFQRGFVAQTDGQQWEIQVGWGGDATIRAAGGSAPAVIFRRRWLGGRLDLGDGEKFRWRARGFWAATHVVENDEGFEFVRFRRRFSPPRIEATVELTDSGRSLRPLVPLLLLGWALMLSAHRNHPH